MFPELKAEIILVFLKSPCEIFHDNIKFYFLNFDKIFLSSNRFVFYKTFVEIANFQQALELIKNSLFDTKKEDLDSIFCRVTRVIYNFTPSIKIDFEVLNTALEKSLIDPFDLILPYEKVEKTVKEYKEKVNKIKKLLTSGNLILYFQKIFDRNRNVVGKEILSRLKDDGKIIYPKDFLPIIRKEEELEYLFNMSVLDSVYNFLKKNGNSNLQYHLNLPSNCFLHGVYYLEKLAKFAKSTGEKFCIEITETSLYPVDIVTLKEILIFLSQKGLDFVLDDFGTERSNIDILALLPLDGVKVDAFFLRQYSKFFQNGFLFISKDKVILVWLFNLLRELVTRERVKIYVEGVENHEDFLLSFYDVKASYFQGFHLHKPEPFSSSSQS
ncbi:EAL domain-containing protein [Caldisericum sp.]|uniref:EAL domain-containing protein n=1 Tax=Caldisericum sp. TaxID=2499687 RepID=UPI003D0EB90F